MTQESQPVEVSDLASMLLAKLRGGEPIESLSPAEAAERQRLAEEREKAAEARRRAERVRHELKCLPPKVLRELFDKDMTETAAVRAAVRWALDPHAPRILMLRGGVGVGKSLGAAAALKAVAERETHWISLSWHRPADFISAVLHKYDDNAPDLGAHYVVLDDLGTEKRTDELSEALCAFIDDHGARLIITTNLKKTCAEEGKPQGFRERYPDPRLLDRLRDIGAAVDLKGDSLRRKNEAF